MKPSFGLGILPQQQPGPRQRIGHRLKPGKEQRQNLVADLLTIQLVPIASRLVVPRRQQHREQVSTAAPGPLSDRRASDHAVHNFIQPLLGRSKPPHLRQRRIEQKLSPRQA